MSDKVEVVVDGQNNLGEGPVWNDRDDSIYWVDCLGSRLFALPSAGGKMRSWDQIHSVGNRTSGRLREAKRAWCPAPPHSRSSVCAPIDLSRKLRSFQRVWS